MEVSGLPDVRCRSGGGQVGDRWGQGAQEDRTHSVTRKRNINLKTRFTDSFSKALSLFIYNKKDMAQRVQREGNGTVKGTG